MKLRDPVLTALIGLVLVAALAAGWFGIAWVTAAQDSDLSYGRDRDAVLQAASDGLAVLHSIDYRTAAPDVKRWTAVTVGELHADLEADRADQIKQARKGKTVATARVVRAAVTELDAGRGTSRVIAVLDVQVSRRGGEPSTQRRRMNAELVRVADGWKISALEAAA